MDLHEISIIGPQRKNIWSDPNPDPTSPTLICHNLSWMVTYYNPPSAHHINQHYHHCHCHYHCYSIGFAWYTDLREFKPTNYQAWAQYPTSGQFYLVWTIEDYFLPWWGHLFTVNIFVVYIYDFKIFSLYRWNMLLKIIFLLLFIDFLN